MGQASSRSDKVLLCIGVLKVFPGAVSEMRCRCHIGSAAIADEQLVYRGKCIWRNNVTTTPEIPVVALLSKRRSICAAHFTPNALSLIPCGKIVRLK